MDNAPAVRQSLVEKFANRYSIEPGRLMSILKATAFKVSQGEVSNEQMAALMVVADQYGLNPFTKEIFAFEDKRKGVVPVVSVDGWARIINDHKDFDGLDFTYGPELDVPHGGKKGFQWIECTMHHKNRTHPVTVREHFDEVYQDPRGGYNGPWQSHPKRMHRHKALIQSARLAFGFSGIYDEDEAQRIVDAGGGVVTPPQPGDRQAEGEVMTRTDGLAADLAARARNVTDAEVVGDPKVATAAKSKPMSSATIEKTIADTEVEDELHALLPHIQALPASPQREQIMRDWNARVLSFKNVGADPAVPDAFAGKPQTAAQAKPTAAKPPAAAKIVEKPAEPKPGFQAAPAKPAAPSEEDAQKVIDELKGAKDPETLDLIADRENKRGWSNEQRGKIYSAYTEAREKFDAA